jgi:NitT/TauT family transport system substrate-binding protein
MSMIRAIGVALLSACGALMVSHVIPARAAETLLVTEPSHGIGYLPLYVAKYRGYFAAEGLDVETVVIENGSGPTNALLTGQAFAMIGGPEHDAFAKLKGAELRAIVNVVARGNNYMVAAKGQERPEAVDWADYLKGKTIATGAYSGTPNSITRYLLAQAKLDPQRDVQMVETTIAGVLVAVKVGQAQVAVLNEPGVTQGERAGIWGEPILNIPRSLGPYAYSVINVRADTIEKNPALVQRFVRAMIKGLAATYADPKDAAQVAKQEFPTMPLDDLTATLDRSFADEIWSRDGFIEPAAWTTAQAVVTSAGLLKAPVPYDQIIDMQFVKPVQTKQ